MQAIQDIFGLWDTHVEFAAAIESNADQVRKWKKFGRIPEEWRDRVVEAVQAKGYEITAEQIAALNRPFKTRGRPPARKIQARRSRQEARAG